MTDIAAWFAGRIPDDWYTEPAEVIIDRDEIVVIGTLPEPQVDDDTMKRAAVESRIDGHREDTRAKRVAIASQAESMLGRKVSWGAACGDLRVVFTHLAVPTMTRLRIRERLVLDTLVDSGVARSRSDALAWCVRLVARNQDEWLEELRGALTGVEAVRDRGPEL